jgi:hypothetical protein
MTETSKRTMSYASEKFGVFEDDWQGVADDYERAAKAGGGWVDVPVAGSGVITIWASASVPVHFSALRQATGRAGTVF